jgi:hypothetical protein
MYRAGPWGCLGSATTSSDKASPGVDGVNRNREGMGCARYSLVVWNPFSNNNPYSASYRVYAHYQGQEGYPHFR